MASGYPDHFQYVTGGVELKAGVVDVACPRALPTRSALRAQRDLRGGLQPRSIVRKSGFEPTREPTGFQPVERQFRKITLLIILA
jgi:hypothetical protein